MPLPHTKIVTAHGGPLHGKRYSVHVNATSFHDLTGGSYRVTAKQARWVPQDETPTPATTEEAAA